MVNLLQPIEDCIMYLDELSEMDLAILRYEELISEMGFKSSLEFMMYLAYSCSENNIKG